MAAWAIARLVACDDVVYDRYFDAVGGAAVCYDGDRGEEREFLVIVNGARSYVPWPDGTGEFGDAGQPLAVRLRYDAAYGWTGYCYMFHGDDNPRAEWQIPLAPP